MMPYVFSLGSQDSVTNLYSIINLQFCSCESENSARVVSSSLSLLGTTFRIFLWLFEGNFFLRSPTTMPKCYLSVISLARGGNGYMSNLKTNLGLEAIPSNQRGLSLFKLIAERVNLV
jgi:hypothetical protein